MGIFPVMFLTGEGINKGECASHGAVVPTNISKTRTYALTTTSSVKRSHCQDQLLFSIIGCRWPCSPLCTFTGLTLCWHLLLPAVYVSIYLV